MKSIQRILTFIFLFILVCINGNLRAQVAVETSKEKVIISGHPYYIHTVKKGQTAYSVSRAYGISVQDLTSENPLASNGIREGQRLRIPAKQIVTQKNNVQSTQKPGKKDENKFIYHSLKPGETIYSLSKLYGVSEDEIVQSNPGIDINKLSTGAEIAIPKREFMNQRQQFIDQDKKYIYHKVERGETLSSIAEKYGLTLKVLRKENRNIRFPKVGDYIRIPGKLQAQTETSPTEKDTVPDITAAEVVKLEKPSTFTPVKELKGSMNIAVLLPFYLNQNSRRLDSEASKNQNTPAKRSDDWIYPESLDFVEMYNGILLAADTLRSAGLDVNLFTYDIKGDTTAITKLIKTGKLAEMNLIIGPVYSRNLGIVSRYAKKLGIPVVSPVNLLNNSVLTGNPTLFIANPSEEVVQKALAKKISQYNNSNLVFIHSDSIGADEDVKKFKSLIFNELTYKMPFEEIKFRELGFYSRSVNANDSINRLSHALSENSENIVIIATDDPPIVSEIITIIHGLSKRFNVKIFSFPSMMQIKSLDPKIFFDLNQLVFSPNMIDYSNKNVKNFNLQYYKKFLTMPLENSYAWTGYDIAYFFISGISIHGKKFIEHPEIHNPALLQDDFDFERKSLDDGFENQKLFKIRYNRNYEVKAEN